MPPTLVQRIPVTQKIQPTLMCQDIVKLLGNEWGELSYEQKKTVALEQHCDGHLQRHQPLKDFFQQASSRYLCKARIRVLMSEFG